MSMIKCKRGRVKIKGSEAEIVREAIAIAKALDDCIPLFWDIVFEVCERTQAKSNCEKEDTDNDVNS